MPAHSIVTAIDLGTDKCATLIASINEQRQLQVLGVSVVPARGMRRSQIIDLEKVLDTITQSLDGAERMAGLEVKSAYVSVGGTHIQSLNSKGVVAVASPQQEIIKSDVERVTEAARALSLPSDRQIIHVIPNAYKVDSQEGIKDPVGMTGVRLESEAHIITGLNTTLINVEKCLVDLGLQVDGFVFSGLAAAEVTLTETEKELGVALIDIGAGSTSICAYQEGSLVFSASLPVGARHITQDIALGCRVSLETAEKIKVSLSDAALDTQKPLPGESKEDFNTRKKKGDVLRLQDFGLVDSSDEVLSKKAIVEGIMAPRIQEIFSLIEKALTDANMLDGIPAGIVLTGGGACTQDMATIGKKALRLAVRVGEPTRLSGLTSDIHKPSFATAIGLLEYGKKLGGSTQKRSFSLKSLPNIKLGGVLSSVKKLLSSLLP
ncbi:MAG: cell division protein FtsA [Candidatus Pacebacteria bacterium RIFCSPHIGHO2_01_FULL_46_16]|nr:MAG: cell division protein FtsA [Candidatus Pacebacteria bacterium RIFCSPHIGHO2_01_FULL_46_16]